MFSTVFVQSSPSVQSSPTLRYALVVKLVMHRRDVFQELVEVMSFLFWEHPWDYGSIGLMRQYVSRVTDVPGGVGYRVSDTLCLTHTEYRYVAIRYGDNVYVALFAQKLRHRRLSYRCLLRPSHQWHVMSSQWRSYCAQLQASGALSTVQWRCSCTSPQLV